MQTVIDAIKDYMIKMLGLSIAISDSVNTRNQLAAYLANTYSFYVLKLNVHTFLLVYYPGESIQNPSTVRNNLDAIREKTGMISIYACQILSKDFRRDLIRYKVPFIVPNQQLYLPDLGINLIERISRQQIKKEHLTPNAQLTVLSAILSKDIDVFNVSRLTEIHSYSVASASRMVKEFKAIGALSCERSGKEQICRWSATAKELWELVLPHLTSPVRCTYIVKDTTGVLNSLSFAGLSAWHPTVR